MWALLVTTVVTSLTDSFNPFGITQQFVLQGLVKKRHHIWYFIVAMGATNFAGGLLAYFGLFSIISKAASTVISTYSWLPGAVALVLGILLIWFALPRITWKKKVSEAIDQKQNDHDEEKDKASARRKVISVAPLSLVFLGIGATISELTTALPYFAYLTILFSYQPSLLVACSLLVLYNILYSLPLIILYIIYVKAEAQFTRLYMAMKKFIGTWAEILGPTLAAIIGIALGGYGIKSLFL